MPRPTASVFPKRARKYCISWQLGTRGSKKAKTETSDWYSASTRCGDEMDRRRDLCVEPKQESAPRVLGRACSAWIPYAQYLSNKFSAFNLLRYSLDLVKMVVVGKAGLWS